MHAEVICRFITLKDKERKIQAPLQRDMREKKLNVIIEVLDEVLFTLFSSALKNCNEALILN